MGKYRLGEIVYGVVSGVIGGVLAWLIVEGLVAVFMRRGE